MILSYSQLNVYSTCPYRYYCQYIMRIDSKETEALRFGKEFHDKIFSGEADNEQIYKMQKVLWENDKFKEVTKNGVSTEVPEVVKLGNYWFYVRHDALDFDGKYILEFKSAAREWKEEDFQDLIQPYLSMAINRKAGGNRKFIYFIITKHKKPRLQIKEIPFNKKEYTRIKNKAEDLMKDFFYLKNQGQHCYFCPYQKICTAWF